MAIRKKFIKINVPIINEEISVLGDAETLDKKTIKLDLSRKLRGKGIEVVFVIKNEDGKLVAHPKNMTLMRSYIQRMMRKRISYVEDSFTASCRDVKITIKPFLITRKKVSRAIRNNLRKTTKDLVLDYIKEKSYIEIAEDILHGNLQKELHPKLKKIYPLSLCEIRVLETKELEKAELKYEKESVEKKEEVEKEESVEEGEPKEEKKKVVKKKTTKKSEKKEDKKDE